MMAANRPTPSLMLQMSEDLTCAVCQDVFQDPRFLPCHHVYCFQCIQHLVTRAAPSRAYSCPECRASVGVDDPLPPAYLVNRMKDLVGNATRTIENIPPSGDAMMCTTRQVACTAHRRPLDRYCRNCAEAVCSECCGPGGPHQRHLHDPLARAAEVCKSNVMMEMASLRQQRLTLEGLRLEVAKQMQEITGRCANAEEQVGRSFDTMSEILDKKRKELLWYIEESKQNNLAPLSSRQQKLETAIRAIDNVFVTEDQVRMTPDQVLLKDHQRTMAATARVKEQLGGALQLQNTPLPEPIKIAVEIDCMNEMAKICDHKCRVNFRTLVEVRVIPSTAEVGKISTISFELCKPLKVSSIVSDLISVATKKSTQLNFFEDHDGHFLCTYCPENRGNHHLHLEVNDNPVVGSPFNLFVSNLSQMGRPIRTIASMLSSPIALSFNSKKLMFVSEYERNQVIAFDNGTQLKGQGIPWVDRPWGMVVDEKDDIIVSEYFGDCVSKFTCGGTQLKTVGKAGSGFGEFHKPAGVAITDETICVCDLGNNRVQVFDKDLGFLYIITPARGKVLGGVTTSPQGELYVTTTSGVEVFFLDTGRGTWQRLIRHGDLTSPSAVHYDKVNRALFVIDYNLKGIIIFTPEGEFVAKRMVGISSSYGMASDEDGYLYVCDSSNGQIQVF